MFDIREFIEFNERGRAICPSCEAQGKGRRKNLALIPDTDGAYKCHRGCTPAEIRGILGVPKAQQIPASMARSTPPAKPVTVSPQKVREASERLLNSNGPAMKWLVDRGITPEMIQHYRLGVARCKIGDKQKWGIAIPIPNHDGTAYYQKKRVCPWDAAAQELPEYEAWKQFGIPPMVYFTHRPAEATETWLCEGEWDAIRLGWVMREQVEIAIATFTSGAGNIPTSSELDRLPGQVIIFYDRNDQPLKNGTRPGDNGAQKAYEALSDRARIGLVPMHEDCEIHGWDVSNALDAGFTTADFMAAARAALKPPKPKAKPNGKGERLIDLLEWNDDLLDTAPEYVNWLVDELLTCNELFLLAAGPRAGKSLLAMTLARSVAAGEPFLGRPVTQGTVVYVRCEDGRGKVKQREIEQGWERGLPVAWLPRFKLDRIDELREVVEATDARLVVLDTLSRIKDATISESSAEMSQLLEPLQDLADEMEVCILLVHHLGKLTAVEAGEVDVFNLIRGSSAIRAVCRGSMVIASGERDYRLLVENGWGKHDLKVVLDANTLRWKLLGRWNPVVNLTQKEQIIDFLKQVKQANIEQIHEGTGIQKKSLYEQLARLQVSEIAEEKVLKEGSRRNYTYRLALFNNIQQLNSVLNSGNSDSESDTSYIQQKNLSSVPERGDPDYSIAEVNLDHPHATPHKNGIVEYTPSNIDGEGVSPIQHPIQQLNINGHSGSVEHQKMVVLNSGSPLRSPQDHPARGGDLGGDLNPDRGDLNPKGGDLNSPFEIGDKVEILSGRQYGKRAYVQQICEDGQIQVNRDGWAFPGKYARSDLRLLKRGGGEADA